MFKFKGLVKYATLIRELKIFGLLNMTNNKYFTYQHPFDDNI